MTERALRRRSGVVRGGTALIIAALAASLTSCAADRTGDGPSASHDDAAATDASVEPQQSGSPSSPARLALAAARTLAAPVAELAQRLDPSPAASGAIAARLPSLADGALRVGLVQRDVYTLTVTPAGARGVHVEEPDGHAVYRDAYPATDVIFATGPSRVEWMYVLRDESAPSRFEYALELPPGLPVAKVDPMGGLTFADERGHARLHIPEPFAVDANGTRRRAAVTLEAGRLVVSVDARGLAYPVLLDPALETVVWEERTPSTAPAARFDHALAYDGARGKTVLFGGFGTVALGDTWEWDGASWTLAATTGPEARRFPALAYDSAQAKVVLFGGTGAGLLGDTWRWDGASWALAATTGPSARYGHALAFDGARGKTILFGGLDAGLLGDTWAWDGASWTLVATTGPSARYFHAMTYDAARAKVVLFGGFDSGLLGDTWEWDGASWKEVATTGPSPRQYHAMAYDSARGRAVLFGGYGSAGFLGDTWEWDGASWKEVATTGPPVRDRHAMAYDSARGETVVFGGSNPWTLGDTWEYRTHGGACSCSGGGNCAAPQCDTGYCVDGVCCEASSLSTTSPPNCATCERCDSAASPGVCEPITSGQDSDTCTGMKACGPTGVCGAGNGQSCTPGVTVCASGHCVDGRCCDTACSGACDACDGATLGWPGAVDGTCAIAPAGFAGTPTCTPYQCNGASAGCPSPCGKDADCVAGTYCDAAGGCVAQKTVGASCDQLAGHDCNVAGCRDCASGFCVDGHCCASGCGGACQTCAATPGTCTAVTSDDDVSECTGATTCDASGACKKKPGEACAAASECASGFCTDGVCCTSACNGGCDTCDVVPGYCTLVTPGSAGANPSCAPYLCAAAPGCPTSCEGDAGCADGFYCDASGACVARKAQGATCDSSAGADCREASCRVCDTQGQCVDGRCCETACDGACDRCDGATLGWTGATDGTCATAPAGYPGAPACGAYACTGSAATCTATSCAADADCGPSHFCDASGHCAERHPQGGTCDAAAGADCLLTGCRVCATDHCVDGYCCNSDCEGQCSACDAPSTEGTCVPVVGPPHGGRPACASGGEDVCVTAQCDGTNATSCTGYVGPSQSCRAASCSNGVGTLAAACDGKGKCPAAQTKTCEPYVCAGAACGKAPCATDADCAPKFKCAAPAGKTVKDCVPRDVAKCDGDHTVTAADGVGKTDCTPYRCEATGACKTGCGSIDDCAAPNVCDANGHCTSPEAGAVNDGGCGCRTSATGRSARWAWWGLTGLALLARRKRRVALSGAQTS